MGSGGSKKKKKEGGSTKVKVAPAKGKERGSVASDASGADRASIVSEGDGDGNKALFADGQRKRPGTSRSRPATAKAKPKSDGIDIRGVSVSFLKELKIKVEAKKEFLHAEAAKNGFTTVSTAQVCQSICALETESDQCAYIDLFVNTKDEQGIPYIAQSNVFCSHAWRYDAKDVLECMIEAADAIQDDKDSNDPLYFWFDIATVCQHEEQDESRDQAWWADTFKEAIRQIGYTLLILMPWSNPIPMTRAWCLWEILSTISTNVTLRCQMPRSERSQFRDTMINKPNATREVLDNFGTIDGKKAEAWSAQDREMIFEAVEESIGFNELNIIVKEQLRSWVQKSAIEAEKDLMDVAANASKQPAEFDLKEHVKNTVNFQFQFGKLLKELGNYGDSYKMLLRCEELAGDVWKDKDEHQNLASLHTEVGLAAKQLGDVDTAERYYKKAFQLYEDDGEVITKEVAVLQLKFGALSKDQSSTSKDKDVKARKMAQALSLFEQSKMIIETLHIENIDKESKPPTPMNGGTRTANDVKKNYSETHDVLGAMNGCVLTEEGQAVASDLTKVLADVFVNIGACQKESNQWTVAKESYLKAKECYLKEFGRMNLPYARCLVYLGNLDKQEAFKSMQQQQDDKKVVFAESAVKEYEEALKVYQQVVGKDQPDNAGILTNIGMVFQIKGDAASARNNYELALAIYKKWATFKPREQQLLDRIKSCG